ncbi:MAG TPA: ATP-binding protein [Baekduia sp.]|uniref:ATP-binding protein n=1 Tax=Baekduia sp. TaxID=2600305 RepID=UPI002B5ABB00|nr:ATP-binding protein [Baekduia sp.]HMJ35562.1 ATP-binding protein [Baekduia sp.]
MASATSPSTDILLAFAPVPEAVRTARHAMRDRGLNADLDHTVSLLTSELVGNAVRHAGAAHPTERIVFHARLSQDHVRVEVADHGPGFDPEIRHETAGFGLRLVDKLASRWGVERTARGCRVWFEVDRRSGRFERD